MESRKSNPSAPADRKPEARRVPATDMQTEDAGTEASGTANQGSPAAPVMKQSSKTEAEAGERSDERR